MAESSRDVEAVDMGLMTEQCSDLRKKVGFEFQQIGDVPYSIHVL